MPSAIFSSSDSFELRPLSADVRKSNGIGAEVLLKVSQFVDPSTTTDADRLLLRQALFEHSVIVSRKQKGTDPQNEVLRQHRMTATEIIRA